MEYRHQSVEMRVQLHCMCNLVASMLYVGIMQMSEMSDRTEGLSLYSCAHVYIASDDV